MARDVTSVLGLDFGSSHIAAVVCELVGGSPVVKGLGVSETAGLQNGAVVDEEAYKLAIDRAIKRAEQVAGLSPKRMIANVPYLGTEFVTNIGLVLSADEHHIFTESDKKEGIRRSKNIVKAPDKKMMHVIPLSYSVGGVTSDDPIGMVGNPLEVTTHIILGDSASINEIVRHSRQLEKTVEGIAFDGLGAAFSYLTDEEREEGAILFDIGGQYSKVHYFKNNKLVKSAYLKYGGMTITRDIAMCLKVSTPEAERLKILYGQVPSSAVDSEEKIEMTTLQGRGVVKREQLCQIIEARLQELLQLLAKAIGLQEISITQSIVVGGATSQLPGLQMWLERLFERPIRVGCEHMSLEKIEGASALGLIYYALHSQAISMPKPSRAGFFKKLFSLK